MKSNMNIEIEKEEIKMAKIKALTLEIDLRDYITKLILEDNKGGKR